MTSETEKKTKAKQSKKTHGSKPKEPECEYFGQVPKVHVGLVSSNVKTITHKLTIKQAEELMWGLAEAICHQRRAARQQKAHTPKRSYLKPINTVLLTTHLNSKQMTVLGKERKTTHDQ